MRFFSAAVDTIRPVGSGLFWMLLNDCAALEPAVPGQFVMVRPNHWAADPLLGRPLSLLGVSEGQAEFLIQEMGRGTADLVRLRAGQKVSVLGPAGSHFTEPKPGVRYVLVAGGVGLAPLLMWLERFPPGTGQPAPRLLYGARTAAQLVMLDRLEATGAEILTATEDGTNGHQGLVTDLLVRTLKEQPDDTEKPGQRVFACGPPAMMAHAVRLCRMANIPVDVSLENRMACGRGICLGCALSTPEGETILVCKHGPVLQADFVDWSGL